MIISTFIQILIISFLINLLWEVLHSQLYTTCIKAPLKKFIPLIIIASIKDGLWITFFYTLSTYIFANTNILTNQAQLLFFIFATLSFSFIDEKFSLKTKRWEYTNKMPQILNIGISPLIELATTGTLTFLYVFLI